MFICFTKEAQAIKWQTLELTKGSDWYIGIDLDGILYKGKCWADAFQKIGKVPSLPAPYALLGYMDETIVIEEDGYGLYELYYNENNDTWYRIDDSDPLWEINQYNQITQKWEAVDPNGEKDKFDLTPKEHALINKFFKIKEKCKENSKITMVWD